MDNIASQDVLRNAEKLGQFAVITLKNKVSNEKNLSMKGENMGRKIYIH